MNRLEDVAPVKDSSSSWMDLADRVLHGHRLSPDEAMALLRVDDAELLDLLAAAYRVRRHWHGNRVHLNFLVNAKSGLCGEDCRYCSQSKASTAVVRHYRLLDAERLLDGARVAAQRRAGTYCIVLAGRTPQRSELDQIAGIIPSIKSAYALRICASVGLLDADQAARLKACGVDRVNHNLNTSRRFYPRICTTHTYDDRLETLRIVRAAGLEICSGGIVGMGEEDADVVELALRLGEIEADCVPVNFLIPISGTAMESRPLISPRHCLKVLALFRLAIPRCELRIAAGRELHLGSLQPLGLYAANSLFIGDYLTTEGQPPQEDFRMIEDLGFEAVLEGGGKQGLGIRD